MCVFTMSLIMSHLPAVAMGNEMRNEMIATTVVVNEMSRAEAEQRVQGYLSRADVQKSLEAQGLSSGEVSRKLASLSDYELNQMTKQMDEARYGGDILVAILIVVLIIFLIKRI